MDENRDGLQPENVPEDLPETIPDITPDIVPDIAPESELQSVPEGGQPPAGAYRGRRLQKENRWGNLWKEYGYIPVTIVVMLLLQLLESSMQNASLWPHGKTYRSNGIDAA